MTISRSSAAPSILIALALAGCADVNQFATATGDVVSGRTDQSVAAAQLRQDQAVAQNDRLRGQLQSLRLQRAGLQAQMSASETRLRQINARLQGDGVTDDQRANYQRLLARQRDLQQRLAQRARAPAPASAGDVAAQQRQLEQLTREREQLERQVDVLQATL